MKKLKCSISGQDFLVLEREEQLLKEFQLPLPDKSALENWIYSAGQAGPFNFQKTICPVTKTPILTRWSMNGAIIGVAPEWFWSDQCDNTRAGQEYDFSRPFFDQFIEVARKSYAPSINRVNCENSPYVNACVQLKDCHLCFACENLRESIYCALCSTSTDLLLCSGVSNSELCYSCLDCNNIYNSRFLQDCQNCNDCFWCLDCIGCKNCFQCVGLRQAQDGYYIRNEKVTAEAWERHFKSLNLGSYHQQLEITAAAEEFFKDKRDYNTNFKNENCSDVYHVSNSKNCNNVFYSSNCEDCKDIIFSNNARDCYTALWARNSERCYFVTGVLNAYNCFFCDGAIGNARNNFYSFCCYNGCHDVFGCFFLKTKNYCILNKEYSKEEYEDLLPRVIKHLQSTGEWGKWFPPELYQGCYQDSWANYALVELTDQQIKDRGLLSLKKEQTVNTNEKTELPDDLLLFSEELCEKELFCESSAKPYKISKQELKAFLRQNCPIPRKHWSILLIEMQKKTRIGIF